MRTRKYTILLASALFIACSDDDNPIGDRDQTVGNTENLGQGQFAATQEQTGIGNAVSHWREIEIRPESRCSPYRRSDYGYSQSVELAVIEGLGGIYSPYTGRCFSNRWETDIEHIIALSEAHDSGLCESAPNAMQLRQTFASDPLNLTLASPELNRNRKRHYDGAEWMPPINQCWFAQRIVDVRRKYGLTIDRREAEALERILSACSSIEMESIDCAAETAEVRLASSDALNEYDDDGNGQITCAEARRHGIAPVPHNHPAYPFMRDGDGDSVVCE